MDARIEQEAAKWKGRGFVEADGNAGVVELVKFRTLSVPWLLFWVLFGLWPAVVYGVYSLLKSDDRVRISVTPGGVLLVDREVSLVNRLGPPLAGLLLLPLALGLVLWGVVRFYGVGMLVGDARKVADIQPVFAVSGAPVFVPGTDEAGPVLRWEGTLTQQVEAAWPGAELICRLKYRLPSGAPEVRESRSALAGGKSTWTLQPLPTEAAPWTKGQPRAFRCETPPGKPAGAVQPVSAVLDVVVSARNGRFPWTTGELPLSAPAAGR